MMPRLLPLLPALLLLSSMGPISQNATAADNTASVGQNYSMIAGCNDFRRCDPSGNKNNEPSCAVSAVNSKNIVCGVNDLRGVDWMKLTDGKAGGSFVSVLKSFDGGVSFRGGLHPGCPETDAACDGAPEIKGLPEATDPTIRSGPPAGSSGVFLYTAFAFD